MRLEEVELLASSGLIVEIIGTLEKGPNLCVELRALTVTAAEKRLDDVTSEELKSIAPASISKGSRLSKTSIAA